MAIEIERKFLVNGDSWRSGTTRQQIRQGYLCSSTDRTVRVRVVGDRAFLTIKGAQHGASRYEYEYGIPIRDATEMLERLCERPLIEKTRHYLTVGGREWVIDEFEGENAGLMIAEVEFEKEGQAIAAGLGGRGSHRRAALPQCQPGQASIQALVTTRTRPAAMNRKFSMKQLLRLRHARNEAGLQGATFGLPLPAGRLHRQRLLADNCPCTIIAGGVLRFLDHFGEAAGRPLPLRRHRAVKEREG
jgi:adenylate cyclase